MGHCARSATNSVTAAAAGRYCKAFVAKHTHADSVCRWVMVSNKKGRGHCARSHQLFNRQPPLVAAAAARLFAEQGVTCLLNTVMPGWSCSGMRAPGGNWNMPMVIAGSSCMSKYVTVPLQKDSHHGSAQGTKPIRPVLQDNQKHCCTLLTVRL